MKKTKYFFDTKFIEDGKTIELISIGIVSEDGYPENVSQIADWSLMDYISDKLKEEALK